MSIESLWISFRTGKMRLWIMVLKDNLNSYSYDHRCRRYRKMLSRGTLHGTLKAIFIADLDGMEIQSEERVVGVEVEI